MASGKDVTRTQSGNTEKGGVAYDQWVAMVGYALHNLDGRSVLNRTSLAWLTYVEQLARERYGGHILPCGLALRELLISCVNRVINYLNGEPTPSRVCQCLAMLKQGLNCQ